jgi:uncharacterized OB-fold protein
MEKFINYLKDNKFAVPYCNRCNAPTWPPVDCCYICMSKVKLKRIKSLEGHLIEYTVSYRLSKPEIFGIIEINGINLIGSVHSTVSPHVGMFLRMKKCGVSDDGTPYYEFGL